MCVCGSDSFFVFIFPILHTLYLLLMFDGGLLFMLQFLTHDADLVLQSKPHDRRLGGSQRFVLFRNRVVEFSFVSLTCAHRNPSNRVLGERIHTHIFL